MKKKYQQDSYGYIKRRFSTHELNIKSIDICTCQRQTLWFKFLQFMLCTKNKPTNEGIYTNIFLYKKQTTKEKKIEENRKAGFDFFSPQHFVVTCEHE